MRIWASVFLLSLVAQPCLGQTVLKSEPLVLLPYEVAFVQDVSCPAGKVLKTELRVRYGVGEID